MMKLIEISLPLLLMKTIMRMNRIILTDSAHGPGKQHHTVFASSSENLMASGESDMTAASFSNL